ncbi:unnamed protein product [Closterium sp. Naga37s-1]|nr:unnamed protein product [Closterium sp. Naga37s-1]
MVDNYQHQNQLQQPPGAVRLYHERQDAALCGVHCLNALLQAPLFDAADLAAIAEGLDRRERAVMAEGGAGAASAGDGGSAEGGGGGESENAAADGDFSIQVLSEALAVWGLALTPLDAANSAAQAAQANPHAQTAFLCHLHRHWFALRRVGEHWFNFNSLLAAPQHLSEFYLAAYLSSLRAEGWTIFVVTGAFPPAPPPASSSSAACGRWVTAAQACDELAAAAVAKQWEEQEVRAEQQREMQIGGLGGMGGMFGVRGGGGGGGLGGDAWGVHGGEREGVGGEDAELARALAASLAAAGSEALGGAASRAGVASGEAGATAAAEARAAAAAAARAGAGEGAVAVRGAGATAEGGGHLWSESERQYEDDLARAIAASMADNTQGMGSQGGAAATGGGGPT